jgi:Ca-activated chloride channel homolog
MKFDFANPMLLLIMLAIPLVIWAMVLRRRSRPGLKFPAVARSAAAAKRQGVSSSIFWLATLRSLALAAMIFALAGPRFGTETKEIKSSGIDIMLDIDISGSMLALDLDWNGSRATRLEVVKGVVGDFIDRRPSDRIGMIAFATEPYLVSPLTLEHEWLRKNMQRIEVGIIQSGTSIGPPLGVAVNRLKEDKNSKSRIVIHLTDGKDEPPPDVSPVKYAEAAAALGIKVYTIAIGSDKRIVPSYTLDQDGKLAKDMLGRPVIMNTDRYQLDEAVLREMAEKGGGKFYRARDAAELKHIYEEIDKLEKTDVTLTYRTEYEEAWLYPLCAGLGLLLLEQLLACTLLRTLP